MKELPPPDLHHFRAAMGWYELGNLSEARAELARLTPPRQEDPDILELRWGIEAGAEDWAAAVQTARLLIEKASERASGWLHLAYASRRIPGGGLSAAWEILRPAADRFPQETIIAYNLACYACQLQQVEEARAWLEKAFSLGPKERLRKMARTDPDLGPLQEEIQKW